MFDFLSFFGLGRFRCHCWCCMVALTESLTLPLASCFMRRHCLLQGEPDEMIHVIVKDVISWLDTRAATKASFPQLSEGEFEERVAGAVPSLINFGRLHVAA
jgi:hypothetical protein